MTSYLSQQDLLNWLQNYFFWEPSTRRENEISIVLGTNYPIRPAMQALRLYQDRAHKIVLTGGWNERLGKTEAEAMASHLINAGISVQDIILENQALHTIDNLRYSIALIHREKFDLFLTHQLVAISYHMRRALLSAQYICPTAIWGTQAYPSQHFKNTEWQNNPQSCHILLSELNKIVRYIPHTLLCWPAPPAWIIDQFSKYTHALSNE